MSSNTRFPEEPLLSTAAEGFGYLPAYPGLLMCSDQYYVVRKLGYGPNSSTWLVADVDFGNYGPTTHYMAVKVLTVAASQKPEALRELEVVKTTQNPDLYDISEFTRSYGHFTHQGPHGDHLCILFQECSVNTKTVRDGLKPTVDVRFAQAVVGRVQEHLVMLHEDFDIVHMDLHPENVMLSALSRMEGSLPEISLEPPAVVDMFNLGCNTFPIMRSQPIPVAQPWVTGQTWSIDLFIQLTGYGHSQWAHRDFNADRMNPRLRPPEVILGAPAGKKIDIWALGCMAFELITDRRLFESDAGAPQLTDIEHLSQIVELTGETFPEALLQRSRFRDKFFDESGRLLGKCTPVFPGNIEVTLCQFALLKEAEVGVIGDFIRTCFRLDPDDRMSSQDLFLHRWIETVLNE